MKRIALVACVFVMLLAVSCENPNVVIAEPRRITFALIIDDMGLVGKQVTAAVHDHNIQGAILETVKGTFQPIAGSGTAPYAEMTTLEERATNYHYFLEFWIDVDGDQLRDAGDLESYADFDVMPSASYSEAKVFRVDLLTVD
jgi:hypothetical protein